MDIRKLHDLMKLRKLPMEKVEHGAAIAVHLAPQSARDEITLIREEFIEVSLTVPPSDETANKALVKFLAKRLGVKPESLEVVAGHSAAQKLVSIIGLSPQEVTRRLASNV